MRLSKCSECDRLINTRASVCVHCRAPLRRTSWRPMSRAGWIAPLAVAGLAMGTCSQDASASTSTGSGSSSGSGSTSSGTTTGDTTAGDTTTGGTMTAGSGTDTEAMPEDETDTFPPSEAHYGTPAGPWNCNVQPEPTPTALTSILFLLLLARRRRDGAAD